MQNEWGLFIMEENTKKINQTRKKSDSNEPGSYKIFSGTTRRMQAIILFAIYGLTLSYLSESLVFLYLFRGGIKKIVYTFPASIFNFTLCPNADPQPKCLPGRLSFYLEKPWERFGCWHFQSPKKICLWRLLNSRFESRHPLFSFTPVECLFQRSRKALVRKKLGQ